MGYERSMLFVDSSNLGHEIGVASLKLGRPICFVSVVGMILRDYDYECTLLSSFKIVSKNSHY